MMRVAVCWRKPLSQTLDEWMKTKCFSNIWHFEYGALPFCKAHISLHGFTKHHKIGSRVCAWGFVMDWAEIQKNACMIQAPFFQAHRSWLILDWHFWHGCAMAAMVFHSNLFVYLHTSDLNPPKRWSEIMIGTGACAFTWLFHPTHRGHPKNWIHNHFIWSIFATSVQHYI